MNAAATPDQDRRSGRALRGALVFLAAVALMVALTALSLTLLSPQRPERCDPALLMPGERCPLPDLPRT